MHAKQKIDASLRKHIVEGLCLLVFYIAVRIAVGLIFHIQQVVHQQRKLQGADAL